MRFVTLHALPCSFNTFSAISVQFASSSSSFLSLSFLLFKKYIQFFSFDVRRERSEREKNVNGNLNIRCIYKRNEKCVIDILKSLEYNKHEKISILRINYCYLKKKTMTTNNHSIESVRKIYDHVWHWIVKQTYESKCNSVFLCSLISIDDAILQSNPSYVNIRFQ